MIVTARWVLPVDQRPIEGGWVEIDGHTIVGVGRGPTPAPAHDLGAVALLPGLVNAHTHLELSWMAGRVPPAGSMEHWIQALLELRRLGPARAGDVEHAARAAMDGMRATGTALVGDISNTLSTPSLLHDTGLSGVVFHELLGFNTVDPVPMVTEARLRLDHALAAMPSGNPAPERQLRSAVVAHAPYSVSPALFSEIARHVRDGPLTVHLGESAEEVEFLRTGRGPFRQVLEALGVWSDSWTAPGCDPVEYVERLGYLQPGLLAVHAVHLRRTALERLRDKGAAVVTCPRSNVWVGAGMPRVGTFYEVGVPVAIGTDSLASNASLNMFDELAELRRVAPDVDAAALLDSATRVGAEVLGFGRTHGTIAPGKRAALVVVTVPADVRDVEEYLVSGVPAAAVRPLT